MVLVFLTFDQIRINMASFSRETKLLFFIRLLIASIPACTGIPGGQSLLSYPSYTLLFLLLVFINLEELDPQLLTSLHCEDLCCSLLCVLLL